MSGGAGSRLWPLSKKAYPKQLLPLVTDKTMVQETVDRLSGANFTSPIFICNADHAAPIQQQMDEIGVEMGAVLIEPVGRNTAPCAVVAALYAKDQDEDALVMLAPADHHVTMPDKFRSLIAEAAPVAKDGYLVTFGIQPTGPETGFGYIQMGNTVSNTVNMVCLLYTSPSPRDATLSRMPSSA